jgi:hypothetical protein
MLSIGCPALSLLAAPAAVLLDDLTEWRDLFTEHSAT